jgi:uncharacterized protein with WD repeat
MFIKEEYISDGNFYTTSVDSEVETEDISLEVEDVSVTLLLFFCTVIIFIFSQCKNTWSSSKSGIA